VKFWAGLAAGLGLVLAGCWTAAPLLAQEAAAQDLARRLGCFACHGQGQGRDYPARPLAGVGGRLTREQLHTALTQPRKLHPGAKMPSYAYLPDAEQQVLVDFLARLK
jgi:cbb3-type cytochrome oxidase cytochrome c subunit